MDLLGQINYGEMLSGLMVTTFLILLNASVVVVSSMVMFPLIDLAFKKKAKPARTRGQGVVRPCALQYYSTDGDVGRGHQLDLMRPNGTTRRSRITGGMRPRLLNLGNTTA
jgi:hypothetical protein